MITYQVDENTNSKKLVESCKKQGLVDVWRWPKRLKGAKDPVGLGDMLHSGRTLLTTDRQIHFENRQHIPDRHSGILIIAKTSSPTTMRIADVTRILSDFKVRFPVWHGTSLRNSIVEICETHVQVWRIERGTLVRAVVRFDQADWQKKLSDVLGQNARRDAIPGDR